MNVRYVLLFLAALIIAPSATAGTIYVSKLGNDAGGTSWATAFTTIQEALDAVPNASGGHTIIVRPDTYMESMLSPSHRGAQGAYNQLIGDFDGALGSGRTGWVVIDSGDPEKGFKSYDWHSTIRATEQGWSKEHTDETFSAVIWDRWKLRHIYATGSDGGLFWDNTNQVEPFTIVVEDCVGVGRAFGGGVASCLSREGEPITFRRTHLWALDWWGDTAAAYVRVENPTMPDRPDIVFEDCTMASPQCALKAGNFGFDTSMRIALKGCTLVALNFSQPQGTPIDGAIQSVEQGKLLHVDLEDTTVMGYKVFGVRVNKETATDIQYTTTGNVQAYVQYQQEVPKGFHRLQQWPVDLFAGIAPPPTAPPGNGLQDVKLVRKDMCEMSPVVWKDRLLHFACVRPASGGTPEEYHLELLDADTGETLARFAEGYGLASPFVEGDTFYAVASRFAEGDWNDVTLFSSRDLKQWEQRVIVTQENEHLFNSSLCKGPDGYVLAYESNDPAYPAFTTKFAQSPDLKTWTKLPAATFGTNRYTACPEIHYKNGYYYVLYLERRSPRHYYETYVTRSPDLKHWTLSSANPVLSPRGLDEGINASDPALVEFEGKTHVFYSVGDQLTWMNVKGGVYPGTAAAFFERWYEQPGVVDHGTLEAAEAAPPARADSTWFQDAKFGIFVHWGLYAVHGKNDAGPYVSWALHDEKLPEAQYARYADEFRPERFDPEAWMQLVKDAGARYLTFTSKHHEGFSLFDSALSEYDSMDTAAKRDIVGELVTAARANDMKISFYYSMLDWHHPDFSADLPRYIDEFLFGQVRELCTNYGPIDGLWFDGEWDHPEATWRAEELTGMIRTLQPNALINDRLGKGVRGETALADFYTREQMSEIDERTGTEAEGVRPWEACLTIGTSWGYRHDDGPPKLIRTLVDVVSRGGNLLLNVGPKPGGEIPKHLAERLRDIGAWLRQNGDGIYGTRQVRGITASHGVLTQSADTLYLHLPEPVEERVTLEGIERPIASAKLLASGEALEVNADSSQVRMPALWPDSPVVTIAIALR
jgi:alpha-L-fucosidase